MERKGFENDAAHSYEFPEIKEKKTGKNVDLHVRFVRHGNKLPDGSLAKEGFDEAEKFGKKMNSEDRQVIKGYSSPFKRVEQTIDTIIKNAPHDRKLQLRKRAELGIYPCSADYLKQWKAIEAQGDNTKLLDWYWSFGDKRPDSGTWSPKEVSELFAHILTKYMKMPNKLFDGSKVDLINGTHLGLAESLLKETLVRDVDGEKKIGFQSVSEIGGGLNTTEEIDFHITTDEKENNLVKVNLRGKEYDVDLDKVNVLNRDYLLNEEKRQQEKVGESDKS